MKSHGLDIAEVKSLAFNAFKAHYVATAQPGWAPPESHWFQNAGARDLWCVITDALLTAYSVRSGIPASTDLALVSADQGFIAGLDMSPEEKVKLATDLTRAPEISIDRIAEALKVATAYDTIDKLREVLKADQQLGRRVYYVNPAHWPTVARSGSVKNVGGDIFHKKDHMLIELHDGTKFRLSPIAPNGGFYRIMLRDDDTMADCEEYHPPCFSMPSQRDQ